MPLIRKVSKLHVQAQIFWGCNTLQSFYNTPHYNKGLIYATVKLWPRKYFYHGILQRNYGKMTMKWSFSYNYFVKLSLYYRIHLNTVYPFGPKTQCYKGTTV